MHWRTSDWPWPLNCQAYPEYLPRGPNFHPFWPIFTHSLHISFRSRSDLGSLTLQVHSRSNVMVLLDYLYVISYWRLISNSWSNSAPLRDISLRNLSALVTSKVYIQLENRIFKQIQDLHASFWCKRVEEPLKSLKIGSHFQDTVWL